MDVNTMLSFAAVLVSLISLGFTIGDRIGEKKYSHVSLVGAWFEPECVDGTPPNEDGTCRMVRLSNNGKVPVNELVVTCVGVYGAGPAQKGEECPADFPCRICLPQLPPGEWKVSMPTLGAGMGVVVGIEIAFVDASGTTWVRRSNGNVVELKTRPLDFYSIALPCCWSTLIRA